MNMATYTTLRKGSRGDDVKKLQTALGIDADGIYGDKTAAAVTEYQKANGLSVDGIAGNQTLGKLYTPTKPATTTTPTTPAKTETPKAPEFKYEDFSYKNYEESDTVKQAQEMLNQQLAQKPGAYQSQWQTQLNDIIGKIMNREKFSYDLNGDALYQQYKDQYVKQGQMAMQDAMGQAAAMTGGYGNSYAQSVGQQTYQGYLQQLNDKVPELYQLALSQYNQEGQDLINQYALLGEQENLDYGRYRDTVSDYQNELNYLTGRYDTERDVDYTKWADDRNFQYGQYADDKNYAYTDHRNQIADQQWQTEFDQAASQFNQQFQYQQDRDKVADEQWQKQFDLAKNQSSSSGSSGGRAGSTGSGAWDNEGISKEKIAKIQAALGLPADGLWGEQSKEAANGMSAAEAYSAYLNGEFEPLEPTENTQSFIESLNPESHHDAIARKMYGSYKNYVDAMLKQWSSKLNDKEFNYLKNYFGL
jgi:peptidoglycan hydrolase-like protein with peptidoglycan-binding domain